MIQEIPTAIAATLDLIGERFGATGKHLWAVFIRQERIDALTSAFIEVPFGSVMAGIGWHMWGHGTNDLFGWWLFGGLLILGGSICAACAASSAITHFMNPEYYALKFVLDTVRSHKETP